MRRTSNTWYGQTATHAALASHFARFTTGRYRPGSALQFTSATMHRSIRAVPRRKPPPLEIVQVGDPVLRRRARPVTLAELASPRIQRLIVAMRDTMRAAPGVGLAAPQIGESIRLAVIEDPPAYHAKLTAKERARLERASVPFHVVVNPTLTVRGRETVAAFEGCLSFDGFSMV